MFDNEGRMKPEMHGKMIFVPAQVGYPGSTISDLIVGDGYVVRLHNVNIPAKQKTEYVLTYAGGTSYAATEERARELRKAVPQPCSLVRRTIIEEEIP